jgi:hypothetical protein
MCFVLCALIFSALPLHSLRLCGLRRAAEHYRGDAENAEALRKTKHKEQRSKLIFLVLVAAQNPHTQ